MSQRVSHRKATEDADVIVVGAGPAGSTAATYLARSGLDVLLLEKSTFPREKVCGDGLTPRGVKQLIDLGVDTREEAGWLQNKGLRVVGGGVTLELDWPDLATFPPYGVVRTRMDFDEMLARTAQRAGARLFEHTTVTGAVTDERTGRVTGVAAKTGPDRAPVTYRAPIVLACDGVSARLALSVGLEKIESRPMGVAVRRYYASPRSKDDYLESHLELWDRSDPAEPKLLPGYGWIFGMGDGTVNVGLGILSTSKAFGKTDYRALLRSWLDGTPEEWGFREHNATGKIGGAALPMGFNRTPHYARGLLLVGDAGGMVNPFNGEGIGYAMESAKLAAECVVQALARPEGPSRERALAGYPLALKESLGSYYRLGNIFSRLIGNPLVMRTATKYGLPRTTLMRLVLKLLAGLYDPKDGDAFDRMITAATRIAPSVRTLYLARHGEAAGDLTDAGRRQATLLGERLAGQPVTALHHSPLPRARQTAELVAASLGDVPVHESELLADYPPYLPLAAELPWAFASAALAHLADYTVDARSGGPALGSRALAEFATAETRQDASRTASWVCWFVRAALGAPEWRWLGINAANAGLTVIQYREYWPPSVITFNDQSHLPPELRWTGC